MKNAIKVCGIFFFVITLSYSQEETKPLEFLLSAEKIKVYDYESETKGFILTDVFEDHYNLKLTNRLYKIRLSYPENKSNQVQELVSGLLEGDTTSKGFETMVWKKNKSAKKEMYEVLLEEGKLKIKIHRKQMDEESYTLLNKLGQAFIKEINS